MNEIITSFTYTDLPAPAATEIEAATTRIKDRLIRQVTDIIETGRDLQEVLPTTRRSFPCSKNRKKSMQLWT